jgi:hypothetical protein
VREKVLGPEHPSTLDSRNNLAGTLVRQGKYSKAETELRVIIALREKVLEANHPSTIRVRKFLKMIEAEQKE